jgi:hypothetical protein
MHHVAHLCVCRQLLTCSAALSLLYSACLKHEDDYSLDYTMADEASSGAQEQQQHAELEDNGSDVAAGELQTMGLVFAKRHRA